MEEEEEPKAAEVEQKKPERRKKKKFDFERNNRTIFVGNLPKSFDQRAVEKLFKSCGSIESARIRSVVADKEKLAPKVALITKRLHPKVDSVNAYVVFEASGGDDENCIKKALAMNGRQVEGHHIRVDRAKRPNAKRETLTSRKKSIFVGNLRFDIRDDDLINHFKRVGDVNYVRIVRDRTTGAGKGFGFVVFNERGSVKKALEMNDSDFKGRKLRIKKVEEEDLKKKPKSDSNKQGNEPKKPTREGKRPAKDSERPFKQGKKPARGRPAKPTVRQHKQKSSIKV